MSRSRRVCAAAALLCGALASAQEKLEVDAPSPATIRLGDTSRALIRIEGRTADPRPFTVPPVPGLQIEVSAPTRRSHTFFDGRTLTERSGVQYELLLRPVREGTFVVPPFPIWTGTREQQTRELRLEVKKDLRGEELGWLEVTVEPRRVYVHEPVRIHVEFGVEQGLRIVQGRANNGQPYYDLEVQAPWLAEFPGGERIDLPPPQGDLRMIVWNGQSLFPAAYEAGHERGAQRWHRFAFDLAYLPTRLGTIELAAPMLRYDVLVREGQQDIFGLRRGQQNDNFYAYGKPITIEVLPIPEVGRPTPYFGAVGRFELGAALDRDTVVVGNSVKLTLTVRGQGNFEFLRLPACDDLPGFHKLGQAEAKREADRVVVTYDLTPLSTDVVAVPPVRWNWFDTTPGVEKFVAVETPALPLLVKPLANGETLAPLPAADAKAVTPGKDDVFDLPALDGPPVRLLAWPAWLPPAAVLAPWLLAFGLRLGLARWRARRADVAGQRARGALRACEHALARHDATEALVGYLADRLGVPAAALWSPDLSARLTAAGLEPALVGRVVDLVDRGTAARYGGGSAPQAADVRPLVHELERRPLGARGVLPFLLPLLAVAALSAPVRAQGGDAAATAVAQYRAGDHAAAEAAFARAFERTGDRRLWRARGNCFFRLGDLPRALWAYECAALGTPRDPELQRNLELVRTRLEVDRPTAGFIAELQTLRDRLSMGERVLAAALCMAAAAGFLVLGWRRVGLRWIGALALVPGLWLAVDLVWLAPARPPLGIVLQKTAVVAEPRAGLDPVATVRAGVALPVLGGDQGAFLRVAVAGRSGYVPRESVAIVR